MRGGGGGAPESSERGARQGNGRWAGGPVRVAPLCFKEAIELALLILCATAAAAAALAALLLLLLVTALLAFLFISSYVCTSTP
jgi:hypothetical protein